MKPFENVNIQKIINLTNGGIEIKYYTKYNTYVMDVLTWDSIFIYANRIYESGLVKYCHPNFIAPVEPHSDPMYSQQYYLNNQNNIDINAPEAWAIINNQQTIRIAIIDEGVEDHEDLNNKVLQGMTVSYSNSRPNTYGRPCSISQPSDALNRSTFAHGQSCAGIVTADHNNIGIKGVINNAEIVPINIFNNWYDTTINYYGFPIKMIFYRETANDYATAINEAWDTYACDVINNSWGYKYVDTNSIPNADNIVDAINNALLYGRNGKGSVVVFSSGNENANFRGVVFPANTNGVIAVGAVDKNGIVSSYSSRGEKLSVVAPSSGSQDDVVSIDRMGSLGYNNGNYTDKFGGTSAACPQVSGVAALVLSVKPNLTAQQVKDIIETTAKRIGVDNNNNNYIYSNSPQHPNGTWNFDMGYGIVDAYAAVQKAMNYRNDLYIRDTVTDDGSMPSCCYSTWDSPDIWVETLDGDYVAHPHGNTKYAVRVRIHNRRDVASSGTERLFLNWAKAGFNDSWDEYWTGNNPLPCGAPKGGVIGSANGKIIPSIPANSYRIDTIHWITPAGEDYEYCTDFNYNQWHFCLLARIHDDDVIAHENEHDADVHQLVKNHNNVAQQNVYLDSAENYRKTLGIGNVHTIDMSRIINLSPKVIGNVGSITDYAEVYITLDAGLLNVINSANITGLDWVNSNTLRWNGGSASIPVTLPANSYYTLQTTVHFIADQIPASNNFDFDMVLRNATGDSILGGEHYRCVRTNGRFFQTCISRSESVLWGESVTLTACDIEEDADYQWYDEQGNSIGNGLTCNVNPLQNTTYTLRVTADADGYRAYSTVDVMVVDGELRLLAPNPADNQVRIGYALSRNVSAATLQILNGSGQVVYTQALSGGNGSKVTGEAVVNTSSLAASSYTVRLISSNGKVHDSKTLVVR